MDFIMNSIITDQFKSINASEFSKQLASNGYCVIENAISDEVVEQILSEAQSIKSRGVMNVNDIQMVDYHGQNFISHTLASMLTVANLITHDKISEISQLFLGDDFRLKAQRYYESGKGYQLDWHVDNKTVDNVKTKTRGLVFIVYLVDTQDGQLEVIKGSNAWSGQLDGTSFSEEELKSHASSQDYLSIPGKKGTIVVTDIYTIHRTKKITTNFRRKSLFFQIDDDMLHSEKIIINPEYFPRMGPHLQKFLGFGAYSGYQTMPSSSSDTLSVKGISANLGSLFLSLLRQLFRYARNLISS